MKPLLWICMIAIGLLLAGCKSREAQLAGDWNASGPQKGTLSLKDDKTFTLGNGNANSALTGKWSLSGDTVQLTPETAGGKPVADLMKQADALAKQNPQLKTIVEQQKKMFEHLDLTVAKDNKTMDVKVPMVGGEQKITFTKA